MAVLNFQRDKAVELFCKACDGCEPICSTQVFDRFVHYAVFTHYAELRPLLQFALNCADEEGVENAARQIVVAELDGIDIGPDAVNVCTGSEAMRKAAIGVYARNLSHETVGGECAEKLQRFFNDDAEQVRQEVAGAFWNVTGERLLELQDFIAQFIESKSFEDGGYRLLHALEESNLELPNIVCRAAERVLEFVGEDGSQVARQAAMVAHSISTLIVRQYEQASDAATKTRCLNLIDRMEQVGYYGIADELSKVDR